MDTKRIESYKQFAKYLEYPIVIFEAESGKVLDINYEAELVLGSHIENIHIEPGRTFLKGDFWEELHDRKSLMWQSIRLTTNEHEYVVGGLVGETIENDCVIYFLLFQPQTNINAGNLILERVLQNAGIVALHFSRHNEQLKAEYISKNINRYGYTRDQMYDSIITFADMICPEDWERVEESVVEGAKSHKEGIILECRMFTESRELVPVRIHIRYDYNEYDNLVDLGVLLFDLREERQRISENVYLSHAIDKVKSVVMVKSYHEGKRTLKYISPNAEILGINADALVKGYKLTEDYIHPADRDLIIDTVYQAVANGVTDYVQSYRMVRDDGKQIWVQNEVTVNRISDGEAEISFLLTDITEHKNVERELAGTSEDSGPTIEAKKRERSDRNTVRQNTKNIQEQLQLIVETLNQKVDYYTVVLNTEGGLMTNPVGPMKDIGQFYDLFERPQFKERFNDVAQSIQKEGVPQSISFHVDKLGVYMVFAPLTQDDIVIAYWVLASFAKNGEKTIDAIIDRQWRLVDSITKCFYAQELVESETKRRKITEVQLQREQQGRQIVLDMMSTSLQKGESCLGEICQRAGSYLSVANIGIYLENKDAKDVRKYFVWNRAGGDVSVFDKMGLSYYEYQELKKHFKEYPTLIIDKRSSEPFIDRMISQTGQAFVMLQPIMSISGIRGYVVYTDTEKMHEFEEKDIMFASCVSHMFANLLLGGQQETKTEILKEGFFEAYDHIRDAVFIKDNRSGDIIFANKAMDKLFGYSLVGLQAIDIVNDQLERYKSMGGVRKRFITNKTVSKWQSYIKELDQIMNVVEIQLRTINKADYSLYILKKNKKKKNESET